MADINPVKVNGKPLNSSVMKMTGICPLRPLGAWGPSGMTDKAVR
jgi:hypothetical protein